MFAGEGERLKVWIEPATVRDDDLDLRRMQLLVQAGEVTGNELRAWAGLPPRDYGDGPAGGGDKFADLIGGMVSDRLAALGAEQVFGANQK
jgi:hypothetical protein